MSPCDSFAAPPVCYRFQGLLICNRIVTFNAAALAELRLLPLVFCKGHYNLRCMLRRTTSGVMSFSSAVSAQPPIDVGQSTL